MIFSVLVANRGEIARRVLRTCRDMGVGTVAVHSDADRDAPHVAEADAAVRLPGDAAADTYLRSDLLVAAALRAGADAVHPGYGFLSENADFAESVVRAGLVWIGPPAPAIAAMGSKVAAKRSMAAAGVPVLAELDPARLTADDLPVLLKASAGGGGRGMRVVRRVDELSERLAEARAEASAAFGDDTVFAEPYLETGRHIEVQILADAHGRVWTLGERECSIQRRHQKIIEETPSPLVTRLPWMRERLFDASRRAASVIGYVGAGTVEFLADDDGRFFFLEMNTRLQVEHPVTECTFGVDLVRWQLRIADGAPLPEQAPTQRGHAVEARLYAEDPLHDWRPQAGSLHRFEVPGVDVEFDTAPAAHGLRLDSGVVGGGTVPVHYDPMLAKLVAWGEDRAEVARRLATALGRARLHGLVTNRDLLVRTLRHPRFLSGDTDTAFLDRHGLGVLAEPLADKQTEALSALAVALAGAARRRRPGVPSGWRNVPAQPQRRCYRTESGEYEVAYRLTRAGLAAEGYEGVALLESAPDRVVLDVHGVRREFLVTTRPGLAWVDSALGAVALRVPPRFAGSAERRAPGSLAAPMPGTVARVDVSVGDTVTAGAPLLVLEAMKMQHTIGSHADGTVTDLPVAAGQQVEAGAVLAVVAPDTTDPPTADPPN